MPRPLWPLARVLQQASVAISREDTSQLLLPGGGKYIQLTPVKTLPLSSPASYYSKGWEVTGVDAWGS